MANTQNNEIDKYYFVPQIFAFNFIDRARNKEGDVCCETGPGPFICILNCLKCESLLITNFASQSSLTNNNLSNSCKLIHVLYL